MASKVEDSDSSDEEWSQSTYSNASTSPSPPLKSIHISYHLAIKRKTSTLDYRKDFRLKEEVHSLVMARYEAPLGELSTCYGFGICSPYAKPGVD